MARDNVIRVRLSTEFKKRLERVASEQKPDGIPVAQLVRKALDEFLTREDAMTMRESPASPAASPPPAPSSKSESPVYYGGRRMRRRKRQ